MKQSKKTFFIAFFSVFAVISTVFVLGRTTMAQENQITVERSSFGSSMETAEQILSLLQELNALQLDDSIFTDPMFLSLKDFHIDLTEEPKQRSNPFAPIGQDAVITESVEANVPVPEEGRPII